MATAAAVQQPPVLEEEEVDDDFVLIELVLDGRQRDKTTPKEPDRSKQQNPKSGPPKVPESIPNFEDYEDFVEITVEEANVSSLFCVDTLGVVSWCVTFRVSLLNSCQSPGQKITRDLCMVFVCSSILRRAKEIYT